MDMCAKMEGICTAGRTMAQPMSQSRTVTAYSGIDCCSLGGRWLMTEALRGIFKLVTYRQRYPSLTRLLYRVGRGDGDELKGIHEQNSGIRRICGCMRTSYCRPHRSTGE